MEWGLSYIFFELNLIKVQFSFDRMFLFHKRSKTPTKRSQDPDSRNVRAPVSPEPEPILNNGHIGRILVLEEKLRCEQSNLKLIEELVQLYAVSH